MESDLAVCRSELEGVKSSLKETQESMESMSEARRQAENDRDEARNAIATLHAQHEHHKQQWQQHFNQQITRATEVCSHAIPNPRHHHHRHPPSSPSPPALNDARGHSAAAAFTVCVCVCVCVCVAREYGAEGKDKFGARCGDSAGKSGGRRKKTTRYRTNAFATNLTYQR